MVSEWTLIMYPGRHITTRRLLSGGVADMAIPGRHICNGRIIVKAILFDL